MGSAAVRNVIFAVEFRIGESERVGPVLARHEESLRDLDARYAFVYESVVDPGKVLVVIGIRTAQPLLDLLRSPYFFEWFDAVGVQDLPAVFVGELVERFDLGEPPAPGTGVVVAAVARVQNVEVFMTRVRDSLSGFAHSGIRRTLVYRAFDTPREVLFLHQLATARTAMQWVNHSDVAAEWLASAGVGAYPPVFVGRFVHAMRLAETAGTDLH
ncbi:fatty-acid--CoA ligase [Mycobacterium sp. EPG1]|nr:fatty-acid--CoA ligase [Mycobacterium sp. EPG1]